MANVGDKFPVGSECEETGRYAHTASGCSNTIILNEGNTIPPCSMGDCPDQGAEWKLQEILT